MRIRILKKEGDNILVAASKENVRVGDYILGDLIFDGPGYQDRLARHASFDNVFCRVRQYSVARAASEEDRQRLKRAAAREFPDTRRNAGQ